MNTPKYILELPEAVGLFPAGRSVVERSHAAKFLGGHPAAEIHRLDADDYRPLHEFPVEDGETVLFVRPGGFGDMLFLTPTFRALKEQCPGCRIVVSTIQKYGDALRGNPDVDQITAYPPTLDVWINADAHVWLERLIEDDPDARSTHAVDLVAAQAGVELDDNDKSMRYVVAPAEAEWAAAQYPKQAGKARVGIQVQASAKARTYPDGNLNRVMNMLVEKGFEVVLFGDPQSIDAEEPFVDLTKDNLTFRQSCAVLATCDVVLAPDSALCHVAGALGLPTLALFGPFPSELRTAYHPSVAAIDGTAPCAPCFHHVRHGQDWPPGCPGHKTGRCMALSNIDAKRVARTVMLLLAGVAPLQTINHPQSRGV